MMNVWCGSFYVCVIGRVRRRVLYLIDEYNRKPYYTRMGLIEAINWRTFSDRDKQTCPVSISRVVQQRRSRKLVVEKHERDWTRELAYRLIDCVYQRNRRNVNEGIKKEIFLSN